MEKKIIKLNRRQFIGTSALGLTGLLVFPGMVGTACKDNSGFYNIRGGIPNSQYFFNEDKAGNQYLFFIGDSVIAGKGLKDEELRYSFQMVKGFKKFFPEANMPERRNMYPGGSWFAQYRCYNGQPVFGQVIFSGHLVVLDFAADDRNIPIEQAKCTIEAAVRQVTLFRNTHSTILVYTLTPEILNAYKEGKTPAYIQISEQIAKHYNIPSVNLAKYAANKIINGEIEESEFFINDVNPTDAGAKIYADAISEFIDTLMTTYPIPEVPTEKQLPERLFEGTNDKGRIIAYEDMEVKKNGSWVTGQKSPIEPYRHILISENIGDSLKLKFKGSEVGIIDIIDNDSPEMEYSVDGATFQKLKPKQTDVPRMRAEALVKNLERDAEHELTVKITSPGVARIGGILLNGTINDPFKSMSRLEQIDAIYSTIDPVEYLPPKGRFANIPKARHKLDNGGELRMVLLGDSIMGNTSKSGFELLVMRDHPKSNIVKIPSLRSSTGCRYYKEENRIKEYVLDHNPDLLVIGGISNGDAESVKSVITQVRQKLPNLEILLLTPVFGAYKEEQIKKFSLEIDKSTNNYRHNLLKVAKEKNCAFFDMTGPLWEYVRNSGKTPGWFMADKTHANERGCQIIGRLLQKWFQA